MLDSSYFPNYGSSRRSTRLRRRFRFLRLCLNHMNCESLVLYARRFGLLLFAAAWLSYASAQYYGSGYPYGRSVPEPRRQLPNTARNIGGFGGNPYVNSSVPPTGLPIGMSHNYFGGGSTNTVARRSPTQKPFSNVQTWGPLITSHQAAQIEVARGLWGYGGF